MASSKDLPHATASVSAPPPPFLISPGLHPRLCFFLSPHSGPRTSLSQKQSFTESSRSFSALRLLSLAYERVRTRVDEPVTYHLGSPPIPSSAPGSASIENVRRSSNAITSVNDRTIASFDICHAFLLKLRTKTKCVLADVGVAASHFTILILLYALGG